MFVYFLLGYVLFSCCIVEVVMRGSWKIIVSNNIGEDVLKYLFGDMFEYM